MQITGTVVKIDRRSGDFVNAQGENIAYDFSIVRVLSETGDVADVRIPASKQHIGVPAKGDAVSYSLSVPTGTKIVVEEDLFASATV